MTFPLAELTVAGAVPLILTFAAALGSSLATLSTAGILHKVLENIGGVKVHHTVHILFVLGAIFVKVLLSLVASNLRPVFAIDDPCSYFRQNFDHKRRRTRFNVTILHELHLLKSTPQRSKHR